MLKNSLKKTLTLIKKNKSKIVLIFFLQVIFFITLSLIFYHTITPAMKHAKDAVDYYDKINITEDSGMFGYLGEDPLIVYRSYKDMMYYIKFMALFSVLAVMIINSLLWAFTDHIISKKSIKQFFSYITNFGVLTLIAALLFYIAVFNTLKSSLADLEYSLLSLVGALSLFAVLLHFIYISYSLIDKRKLKDILKLTFKTGIFQFPRILLIYLINILIILSFSWLIYLTIESNIVILSAMVILFVLSAIFTRLFLIVSINYLAKKG